MDLNSLARDIVTIIMDDLSGRSGFDGALDSIDGDDYDSMEQELINQVLFKLESELESD